VSNYGYPSGPQIYGSTGPLLFSGPYYVVLAWELGTAFGQMVDDDVKAVLADRQHAYLLQRLVVVHVASEAERSEIRAVLEFLITKQRKAFTFVLSPLFPAIPTSVWVGRRAGDWQQVNEITTGAKTAPEG
jgi:hypothetical protein